jgi:hypothetical protein
MTALRLRRPSTRRAPAPVLAAAGLVLLAGCDSEPTGPAGPTVATVAVTGPPGELRIGETLQLTATLRDAQGGQVTGPAVTWESSDAAVATVSPEGRVEGIGHGDATITASAQGRSGSRSVAVRPAECLPSAATRSIEVGDTLLGELGQSDCFLFDRNAQGWLLTVTERRRLLLDLTSESFDAVLVLSDLDLQVLTGDDDGGEGTNARIAWIFEPGTYILWAISYAEGEVGGYGLSVQPQADTSCEETLGSVAPGSAVTGALTHASCIIPSGHFADPWSLVLEATTLLRFDLTSPDLDSHVSVVDANGILLGEDDISGDGLNARLDLELPPGSYTVWASSYWTGEVGPYELRLTALGAATAPILTPSGDAGARTRPGPGHRADGSGLARILERLGPGAPDR